MRTLTATLAVLMLLAVGFASNPAHAQDHACDKAKRPNADGPVIAACGIALAGGDGVVLDLLEAYRMFLIAGEKGVKHVRSTRISGALANIRELGGLTPGQVEMATCLSKYGVIPSRLQRLRCRYDEDTVDLIWTFMRD